MARAGEVESEEADVEAENEVQSFERIHAASAWRRGQCGGHKRECGRRTVSVQVYQAWEFLRALLERGKEVTALQLHIPAVRQLRGSASARINERVSREALSLGADHSNRREEPHRQILPYELPSACRRVRMPWIPSVRGLVPIVIRVGPIST